MERMGLVQVAQHADGPRPRRRVLRRPARRPPTARFDPPGLLFFDLDGVRLLLDVGAPTALLYLRVDDVAATVERLRAARASSWSPSRT